jgi:dTDP-4-dehydrorhamnose reductase
LIHFSTDYVFNGKSDIPYAEDDQTNPLGNYGKTKRLGELAIQNTIDKHIIIRTSWVFSEYGNNFLKTMLRLSETSSNLRIVGDQHGCPTYAHDIAKAVIKIIAKIESGLQEWGIFNFSGDSKTSWHDFANKIFDERLLIDSNHPNPSLTKIASNEFETKAERPMFSTLNNTKIFNSFDITPSDWRNGIKNVLNKIYLDVKK